MISRRYSMKLVTTLALFVTLLTTAAGGQVTSQPQTRTGGNMISSNECMAKGGIGIINTHVYIDLKSAKNELILDGGNRWADQTREKEEVAVFFQNRVWAKDDLPKGFDLSKAIIVSFEGDVVRFFDFEKMSGGYYRREKE
jgi:hypothetical protein